MNVRALKLCLVTNLRNQSFDLYQPFLFKAIRGGITSIQLREKTKNLLEFHQLALQIKKTLYPFKIPLIINDHVEIAKAINADGVHIGQTDISPEEARKMLGPGKIIGWSVETLEEVKVANQITGIDYLAASAIFPSKTKPDCKTIWGIEGLEQVIHLSNYPVIAIGGINIHNISRVMESGAYGAAVIGAIHDHPHPEKAAAELISEVDYFNEKKRASCLRR